MPVNPLSFKGDKPRTKKRKHHDTKTIEPNNTTPSSTSRPSTRDNNTADAVDDDTTWVDPDTITDLSGPIILVLPTNPATCLASDAHGNIFASPLENMVEDNPVTAEPHDVRQVWVASRVAGMDDGNISLKASHGGYLSCDEMGILGARREARGFEECFVVEAVESDSSRGRKGSWRLGTAAKGTTTTTTTTKDEEGGKGRQRYYVSATVEDGDEAEREDNKRKKVAISLRGDGAGDSETTRLILRMQARFKPRLQRDKEQKKSEKVSRAELERVVGRRLEEDEVKRLKRAKRDGTYYEEILDVRVKGKHDKFA